MHSRRSYSFMRSKTEADLWALHWAVKCMKNTHQTKVIFEASSEQIWEVLCNQAQFPGFRSIVGMINNQLTRIEIWSLDYALPKRNEAANAIAVSVTRDRRHQSIMSLVSHTLLTMNRFGCTICYLWKLNPTRVRGETYHQRKILPRSYVSLTFSGVY